MLTVRLGELHAAEEARAIVETRYLDGHPTLFPDAVTAWAEQLRSTEAIANLAIRLAELEGVPLAEPADRGALSARGTELVAYLVQPAKATALERLGEGEASAAVAALDSPEIRLRGKACRQMAPSAVPE
jgi:hypothetical protein